MEKDRSTAKEEQRSISEMSTILILKGLKRHQEKNYRFLKEQVTR